MSDELNEMSLEELKGEPEYELVDGRSGMNKEQLVAAMTSIRENGEDDDDGDDNDVVADVDPDDVRGTGPGALGGAADSGEREYDENYLGVSDEYQNSANASTAPMAADEEEDEVADRVRQAQLDNASVGAEKLSFEDWTGENPAKLSNQVTHADKS